MTNHQADRAFWKGPQPEPIAADRRHKPDASRAWRSLRRGLNFSIALAAVVLLLAVWHLAAGLFPTSAAHRAAASTADTFAARLCAPFAAVPEAGR